MKKYLTTTGCLILIVVEGLLIYIGAWGTNQVTNYFGKDLPWWADATLGFLSQGLMSIVGAIIWLVS